MNPEWIITSSELLKIKDQVILVDVREQEEWDDGFIEGAKHIPLGELEDRAPVELSKESNIILYCAHGMRSLDALMRLKMLGFKKLRSLEGGICAWMEIS
jgi:rhodanese-related sulfurtransferase